MEEEIMEELGEIGGEEEEALEEIEDELKDEEFGESVGWDQLDLRESFGSIHEESLQESLKEIVTIYTPPLEAIAALKESHLNSVAERIRKNKMNEVIDDLRAKVSQSSKAVKKMSTTSFLIDKLSIDYLKSLKKTFKESTCMKEDMVVKEALSKDDLKQLVENTCHTTFHDEQWDMLFMKMDVNTNGFATYTEFINYLLLEFRVKKNLDEDIALWMLEDPIQDLPTFIKSHHQHGVIDITFFPLVKPIGESLRKSSYANGKYFTASEQGTVNMWSLNMELENSQECPSPVLRFAKTCVIKIVALADINLIALSSTERDLRFYDTTGRHYQLKTRIIKLPFPCTALCYYFYEDINLDSVFVFGDSEGSVSILRFSSKQGSPLKKFERSPKFDYQCITYESLLKDTRANHRLKMNVFKNLHAGSWVIKIEYNDTIWPGKRCIVSCANSFNVSMVFIDLIEMKIAKKFKIAKGVNTFCLISGMEQVATGGFDSTLRLWNIKTSKKALASLSGHYAPIEAIYEQHKGARLFTVSRDRIIKVWDMKEMVCIQTCTNKLQELGEAPLVCYYNPYYRKCILAAKNIAHFKLGSEVNKFFSDGYTHVGGVTQALYNSLFKVMVTVGMDSNIMTWDLFRGKLVFVVRKAHKKRIFGEDKPMGITSAIFSPSKVYLLTGALDGTIKMWNFTIGTCLRTMYIKEDCVVTGLIWVPGRILACGWSEHISEWEDKVEPGDCKDWAAVHTRDVLCSSGCGPKAIVTAAYNGELVFYNLQNGHYYNRFFVGKPRLPITMGFAAAFNKDIEDIEKKVKPAESLSLLTLSDESSDDSSYGRPAGFRKQQVMSKQSSINLEGSSLGKKDKFARIKSTDATCECEPPCPCQAQVFKGFAGPDKMEVHCLLFLETRPEHTNIGTLFVGLQTGSVQFWSHHPKGGIVDTFYAAHIIGDHVTTMSSTLNDDFLFTGTRYGYVKIWHIANFCVLPHMVVKLVIPAMRLKFPFLMNDKVPGRAKRASRGQPEPFLCSSCRNHIDRVMHIEILDEQKIYVTCGLDKSVRLWTFGGAYIGTLGGLHPWVQLDDNEPAEMSNYRIPADLTRVVSSTSFKVLTARTTLKTPYPRPSRLSPTVYREDRITSEELERKSLELDQQFRGICNFPEESKHYYMKIGEMTDTEVIQKNMKEPVLRVLNMLKTVGQYDMDAPNVERTAKHIKQLLDDSELKSAKGRPTPAGQPTRTRPKERWVDRLPSYQKFWRESPTDDDQMTVVSVVSQKSEVSSSASTLSTKWRQGLSPEAKNLEFLLREYDESSKGWYKQQYN